MSSALDQIVDIVITQQTQAVPQAGFGIPLIVGPNGPRLISSYSSPSAMLSDGFVTSDIEYVYAVKAFSQALSPTLIQVGLRQSAAAQVDTFAVTTVTSGHVYHFTLNGILISYTALLADTATDILNGLSAAIATAFPTNCPVTHSVALSLLTCTSATIGVGVTYSLIDSLLTHLNTVANHGIADDLANIILNGTNGNLWYGLILCSNQDYDILQVAAYIETVKKIFIAASGDSAIPTAATTDIASVLKGLAYKRTALMYSPASYNLGMDAAWVGGQLPQTPGAATWKFKQLVGIGPDVYTDTQRATLIGVAEISVGKSVNIYEEVGGVNITEEGWMVGGQFIDLTVGIDWLQSTMQTNVFAEIVNVPKIPYTDKGVSIIENIVRSTLKQGSDDGGNGLLDHTSIVVNTVSVLDIPTNTRAQRILPSGSITFSARLTGAFHFIVINGTVSV